MSPDLSRLLNHNGHGGTPMGLTLSEKSPPQASGGGGTKPLAVIRNVAILSWIPRILMVAGGGGCDNIESTIVAGECDGA